MQNGVPWATRAALVVLAVLSLVPILRLVGGGLWEPWELNRAEASRLIATDEAPAWAVPEVEGEGERPPLAYWVTSLGFSAAGAQVANGKLAVAGFTVACVLLALALLWPLLRLERSLFAFAVFFGLPVVFFQGASSGGDGVAFGAYAVAFAALVRLLETERPATRFERGLGLDLAAVAGGLALTYFALGGVMGLLLPVGAATVAALAGGGLRPRVLLDAKAPGGERLRNAVVLALTVATALLVVWFVQAVLLHKPVEETERFALAIGGAKANLPLESFDVLLVRLAYQLFPWCALLPLALAWVMRSQDAEEGEALVHDGPRAAARHAAVHVLVAFPVLAYWSWRFYPAPAISVFPLALLVGGWLGSETAGGRNLRFGFAAAAILTLLVLRDAFAFPKDFLAVIGFPKPGDMVTDAPSFSMAMAAAAALMVLLLAVALLASQEGSGPGAGFAWYRGRLRALRDAVRSLLGRAVPGVPNPWAALRTLLPWGAGLLAWLFLVSAVLVSEQTRLGKFMFTHLGLKAAMVLVAAPLAVLLADAGWRLIWMAARRVDGTSRGAAAVFGGLAVSLVLGVHVAPKLDSRFSLEPAARAASEAGDLEGRLQLFQVEQAAPTYYPSLAPGRPVASLDEAAQWLAQAPPDQPRYLVFPSNNTVLNDLNQRFRDRRDGELLSVVSEPEARYLLAVSHLAPGQANRSPLARYVMRQRPQPMYPVLEGDFDGKVRYLGYDITAYEDGTVAAMQNVTITHYWECVQKISGDYKVFVHIDGMGDRINGDHDPADGVYPTRYWRPGDFIADPQQVRIPFFAKPALKPDAYRIMLGLYRGEARLPLTGGEGDDNRLWGGTLRVR